MPHKLPSIDIGVGSFIRNTPLPKEVVKRVATPQYQPPAPQQIRQNHYTTEASLFNKEAQKGLKKLMDNSHAKFTKSTYDNSLMTSFSGVDTKMSISFRGGTPIYIGEAQTVTYSLFRPIEPVHSLGDSRPQGFVKGQRTVAGSIIFTVFDRNILLNAFYNAYTSHGDRSVMTKEYLTDELPPFDIHLSFMNEYGLSAALVIYGCHIPSEGQVHSVEDMITENTIQYVARDITLMRPGDIT